MISPVESQRALAFTSAVITICFLSFQTGYCLSQESGGAVSAFEQVWTITRDRFCRADMNGVDWEAVRAELAPQFGAAPTPRARADVINAMLRRLKTSHTAYWTRADIEYFHLLDIFSAGPLRNELPRLFPPDGEVVYPGIDILPERMDGRWFVAGVLDGGVAAQAGLRRGVELVSVEGEPFEPVASFAGRAGQVVRLEFREAAGAGTVAVELVPRQIHPQDALLDAMRSSMKVIPQGDFRIAYAHVWSWAGKQFQELLEEELLSGALKDADALVLDLREGWGGASPQYLNLFRRDLPVMHAIDREGKASEFPVAWRKPVTLLVNRGSRSGKELIAYGFQKLGIGPVVGTTTGGAVSAGSPVLVGDDGVLYLAVAQVTVDGHLLEGKGVDPDHEVPWELPWCSADDPQLKKALDITASELARDVKRVPER